MRPGALDRFRPHLEGELRRRVGKRRSPLHEMLGYYLGWTDEMRMPSSAASMDRVHGTLCLLVVEAMGQDPARALPAAAGVELARGFMEVLEDVRLGSPNRGGRPTLWWVFGHSQGLNGGDGLYAMARLFLMDLTDNGLSPETALQATVALDRACLDMCDRQYADIEITAKAAMTAAQYVEALEGEEGALMGCAAAIGAIAGQAPAPVAKVFDTFGRRVGVGARIRRDMDALWGQGRGSHIVDVLDKKRSLPLLYAMERASPADRAMIDATIDRKQPIGDAEAEALVQAVESAGGRAFAEETADRLLQEALEALKSAGAERSATGELQALAEYLVRPEG